MRWIQLWIAMLWCMWLTQPARGTSTADGALRGAVLLLLEDTRGDDVVRMQRQTGAQARRPVRSASQRIPRKVSKTRF